LGNEQKPRQEHLTEVIFCNSLTELKKTVSDNYVEIIPTKSDFILTAIVGRDVRGGTLMSQK
jgi:hypothetical protein